MKNGEVSREPDSEVEKAGELSLPSIAVREQRSDEMFKDIVRLFAKQEFYREKGYQVIFPKDEALSRFLSEGDPEAARKHFEENVFPTIDLRREISAHERVRDESQDILQFLQQNSQRLSLRLPQTFDLVLTPYGPGGSYDAISGQIFLLASSERRNLSVRERLAHEIVHIGVEHLVQRFGLTHEEKERLVGLICSVELKDVLADFSLRDLGSQPLDRLFMRQEPVQNLERELEQWKRE